jgi:hypothetical protein
MAYRPPEFLRPPYFVEGSDVDVVAEFSRFIDAVGEPAAHLLAELAEYHNGLRAYAEIPLADDAETCVRGLCCRKLNGWAVFYAAEQKPVRITVVYAASLNPASFDDLEAEAASRLARLG